MRQDGSVRAAWETWRASVDFEQLEPGAFALLPLLYHNLQHQGLVDPWLVKCKGIYRRTWSQNQLYLQQVTAMVRTLQVAGIQPLLLTDAALLFAHYPNPGLRLLDRVELAIAPEQAAQTITLLQQAGWRALRAGQYQQRPNPPTVQRYRLQHPSAHGLTLYCHPVARNQYPHQDRDLWQRAISASIHHVTTWTQPATDLLLALCTRQQATYSIQWIADSLQLIRASATIDWAELLVLAAQQARTRQLSQALTYLYEEYQAPIPPAILQQLAAMPIQPFEQWEADLGNGVPSPLTQLTRLWAEYQRRKWWHDQAGLGPDPLNLPAYLQQRFELDSPWQLPLHMGKVCLRHLPSVGTA